MSPSCSGSVQSNFNLCDPLFLMCCCCCFFVFFILPLLECYRYAGIVMLTDIAWKYSGSFLTCYSVHYITCCTVWVTVHISAWSIVQVISLPVHDFCVHPNLHKEATMHPAHTHTPPWCEVFCWANISNSGMSTEPSQLCPHHRVHAASQATVDIPSIVSLSALYCVCTGRCMEESFFPP